MILQAAIVHHATRLIGQRVRLGELTTIERDERPFGQGHRDRRRRVDLTSNRHRLDKRPIRVLRGSGEQVRDTEHGERRRPP